MTAATLVPGAEHAGRLEAPGDARQAAEIAAEITYDVICAVMTDSPYVPISREGKSLRVREDDL